MKEEKRKKVSSTTKKAKKKDSPQMAVGEFDFTMLMNHNCHFANEKGDVNANVVVITNAYSYWNKRQHFIFNTEPTKGVKPEDSYVYQEIRRRIIAECNSYGFNNIDYIVNTLIVYLYVISPKTKRNLLWNCFGDVIKNNAYENLKDADPICPVCGGRFKPKNSKQKFCSKPCYMQSERQRVKEVL